jgi:MFS family permease
LTEPSGAASKFAIPRTVWALGLVSLLMDMSSEMIHSVLPIFLTTTLGASAAMVGLIDGIAEATAAMFKVPSGYISDYFGRRKPLILFGYGLAAMSKPLFAIAAGPFPVLAARFADRIGKGIRGAARDALVADVTPSELRGRAYGLRQALDTVGALIGPLIAVALMIAYSNNFRLVFWVAVIPALASVAMVLFGVGDSRSSKAAEARLKLAELRGLDVHFWTVAGLTLIFTLARFSEAFLILKAVQAGLPIALSPLVLAGMSLVYSAGAYPAGALADRYSAVSLLALGLVVLIAADLLLGLGHSLVSVAGGIGLWGAHMALTQGLFAKLVANSAPDRLRGSAFGLFNLASGLAALAASVIAGLLWDRYGSGATFLAGAGFAVVTLVGLALVRRRLRPAPPDHRPAAL